MEDKENRKPKKQLKNAAILTGVAIQMGVTIYLFVLLGRWLDTKYNHGDKLFIIITTLSGVAISLYAVVKQLNRLNND
ncbi:AtpZ/AtpI family protein [Seonamhaeicola sediminis]|uniref:AtpZ/AtpI family protein n=1 Tax=Seonamhaeicola sediminis TaxID=2528206 RepID=A0A562YHG1_9FLAO|nr:AtpZ/AtpI family protein [Seonamhaeicola sediminis]TWO33956.1 AtpZ/AtpI family protein [Seonamhaeicola sediminis]